MDIRNFFFFFGGFVEVANGLACILTLGHFRPVWDLKYYCWVAELEHRRRKKLLGSDKNARKEQT